MCLPNSLRKRNDFISVDRCQGELRAKCSGEASDLQEHHNVISGSGMAVGTSIAAPLNVNTQQLRDHWANKDAIREEIPYNDSVMSDGSERQFR